MGGSHYESEFELNGQLQRELLLLWLVTDALIATRGYEVHPVSASVSTVPPTPTKKETTIPAMA